MIKNKRLLLLIFLAAIFLWLILSNAIFGRAWGILKQAKSGPANGMTARAGEKISYEVKLGRLRLGTAVLSNVGSAEIDGRMLNKIIFETSVVRFKDTETIYSDPTTFLPVKIKREVFNWLKTERITEDYDQDNFTVTVTKSDNKIIIKKDSPIHNPILLSYFAKGVLKFEAGAVLNVNLPKNRFEIKMVSVEYIEVPAGKFKAYRFQSEPKEIEIWVSADENMTPVKIQGIGVFGYSLELDKQGL